MAGLRSDAVRGSEQEVQLALNGCDVPFAVWGGPGPTIWLTNPRFDELVGLPAEKIVGRTIFDFFSGPQNAVAATAAALESGFVDSARSRRTLRRGTGALVPVWVWSRMVTVDGNPGAVSLVLPMSDLGRAGRDPAAPWRSLATVVVGVAESDWRVVSVSNDIADFSNLCSADIVGRFLPDLIVPIDGSGRGSRQASTLGAEPTSPEVARQGRLRCPDGGTVDVWVLYAPASSMGTTRATASGNEDDGRKLFALIGSVDPRVAKDSSARVRELELHLQRIGAEVRAARIMDDVAGLPVLGSAAAVPDLAELSSRQWAILSRLGRGERVPQIAAELFLSQSTVRNHLSAIFRKFGVHSQAELLARLRAMEGAAGQEA